MESSVNKKEKVDDSQDKEMSIIDFLHYDTKIDENLLGRNLFDLIKKAFGVEFVNNARKKEITLQ